MINLPIFKKCFFYLIAIVLLGCNNNKEQTKKIKPLNITKDSVINKRAIYNVDFKEKSRYASMGNDKYLLRVTPDTTAAKENMNYSIVMTLKSDTIINYTINIDSINKNYFYNRKNIKDKKIDFKKNYYLNGIDIENMSARTNTLFIYAKMISKTDATRRDLSLDFKYYGPKTGKLYMYNFFKNREHQKQN